MPTTRRPRRRRTRSGSRWAVSTLAAAVLAGVSTGCVQTPDPFDPWLAVKAGETGDTTVKTPRYGPLDEVLRPDYVPGEAASRPAGSDRVFDPRANAPSVRITLQEIIHRTVLNNLDIRVARYDTAIDETRTLEALANFDPQFFSDLSFTRVDKQTPGVDSAIPTGAASAFNNSTQQFAGIVTRFDLEALTTFDVGFRQNLTAGGKIELKQTVANTWFNPPRGLLNPYYENDLTLTLNQPLLQNFGVAVNTARITISRNNQRVSLLDFRKTVEDTLLKVEQYYWQLVQADRDETTLKKLVAQSEETERTLHQRSLQGQDVTAVQLLQAESATRDRQFQLLQTQLQIGNLSDQLKQLMMDPVYPVQSNLVIRPGDPGSNEYLHFNFDDQLETAFENRLELGQQQVRIESAEIAVDVARNGLLPQLNLTLEGTVDGLARGFSGAFNNEGNFNHDGFTSGLQFVLPLGNRAARSIWERALLQRLQAIASYGSLIRSVTLDVKTAARQIEVSYIQLQTARAAVLTYQKLIESVQKQITSGDTPLTDTVIFDLLQFQQQLSNAEQREHQASSDYNYAIAQLEKAKGTILRYNNVLLEQQQRPADPHDDALAVVKSTPTYPAAAAATGPGGGTTPASLGAVPGR